MAKTYVSVAPLTLVRRSNGTAQHVYLGQPAPGDALPDDVARLVDEGFLAAVADRADALVVDVPTGPPAKSASKDAWVAYAVAQGADEGEARSMKKDDLVAAYGPTGTADADVPAAPVDDDPDRLTD